MGCEAKVRGISRLHRLFVIGGLLALLAPVSTAAANRLVINEIMINEPGSETALEWIELFNSSSLPVSLADFALIDGSDTSRFAPLAIESESFVVLSRKPVTADSAASFERRWGNGSGVWGDAPEEDFPVVTAKFSLRNAGDTISIVDQASGAIERVGWRSSPPDGVSLERINWAISARSSNFGLCNDAAGSTPGRANSIIAPEINLGLVPDSLEIESPPTADAPVLVRLAVVNSGRRMHAGRLAVCLDAKRDGAIDPEDSLLVVDVPPLMPDSLMTLTIEVAAERGRNLLVLALDSDAVANDNRAEFRFYFDATYHEAQINEFVPRATDEGGGEWVELVNRANYHLPLGSWVIESNIKRDSLRTDAVIAPDEMALLCADSAAVRRRFPDAFCPLIELRRWPGHGDDQGQIVIRNDFALVADSIVYGGGIAADRSWERDGDSASGDFLRDFYVSSAVAGGTPCAPNSERILPPGHDLGFVGNKIGAIQLEDRPNEIGLLLRVVNHGVLPSVEAIIEVFDDRNRNEVIDGGELLQTLIVPILGVGDSVDAPCQLILASGRHWLHARLSEDEDSTNNDAAVELTLGRPTREVVITEFLADPAGGLESEWVEVRNNSEYPVGISRWRIGDAGGQPGRLPDRLIMPRAYLVLAQDSAGFVDFYGGDCTVPAVANWKNLNNDGDAIKLLDEFGHLVDSVVYAAAAGGNRSLEVNELEDRPEVARWFISEDERGATPCRTNSVSRILPDFDLAFGDSGLILARDAVNPLRVTAAVWIKNAGRNSSPESEWSLFGNVVLLAETEIAPLAAGESVRMEVVVELLPGRHRLMATLSLDDNPTGDTIAAVTTTGVMTREIVITEFMAEPRSELGTEWVEIRNNSDHAIELAGWKLGDVSRQSVIVAPAVLAPATYAVVAQDTSRMRPEVEPHCLLLTTASWNSLNNSGDEIKLIDEFGSMSDSLAYRDAAARGQSYELDEVGGGWYPATAESGSTPGRPNSVSGPVQRAVELMLPKRVFAPHEGEVLTFAIKCPPATPLTIEVFDLAGRRHCVIADARPCSSGEYRYAGSSIYCNYLPVGVYILKLAVNDGSGFETKAGFAVAAGR